MDRQIPDPLKQLRQTQAAEAELLDAQNKQRAGVLREQEKIREAEAAEKTSNEQRLKTPLSEVPNGSVDESKQEQTINTALREPPAAQGTGDTGPKGPPRTHSRIRKSSHMPRAKPKRKRPQRARHMVHPKHTPLKMNKREKPSTERKR